VIRADVQQMWKDHSEFKRCLSSETQALNEKVQEEI
jgi:hypothetical protein